MKKPVGRIVEPEWLDDLPPQDPRALHSRRDLRRLNATMKHPRMMARALNQTLKKISVPKIVEPGAGDGYFLLSVARELESSRTGAEAILVDRLDTVDPATIKEFSRAGWRAQTKTADVFDWLRNARPDSVDAVVANLFLHHFQPPNLAELFRLAARCTGVFIALEPRRSWFPLLCGHFLWAIGCGPVTRHDAVVSIRAGFLGRELSSLWPDADKWHIEERPAGLFSHLFIAQRKE